MNHARNNLQATIVNLYHNGSHQISEKQRILWGVNYQRDVFNDVLSEWKNVDSAGYTITKIPSNDLTLSYAIKSKLGLNTQRLSGFVQHGFSDAILSFEVFNLLGINNVLSHQWVQDVTGKSYAIPNYLTQRRFNLKLILRM